MKRHKAHKAAQPAGVKAARLASQALMKAGQQNSSEKYEESQRLSWELLRKNLNGLINKVNVMNIKFCA